MRTELIDFSRSTYVKSLGSKGLCRCFLGRERSILGRNRLLTLETTDRTLDRTEEYRKLLSLDCISGTIRPDLPLISSFRDIFKVPLISSQKEDYLTDRRGLVIETIAAQVRLKRQIRSRIKERGEYSDILLCVSGSSYLRRLLPSKIFFQDVLWILREANGMKSRGMLPDKLELWATSNPNLETNVDYLKAKIDAGAVTIVTQPPLIERMFDKWWDMVVAERLHKSTRFLIGVPMISSQGNLRSWCDLCEIPLVEVPTPGSWTEWNLEYLHKLSEIEEIAGFHFMPLTRSAKEMTVEILGRVCP